MDPYIPTILGGASLTVALSVLATLVASVIGMAGAVAKLSGSRTLSTLATIYTTVVRGIPDLVLLLLVFYGGQMVLNNLTDSLNISEPFEVEPFTAGVLTLGIIYGAYLTEIFRGAILGVPRGQIEAGYAIGMSGGRVLLSVTLPQMVRFAIPGFTNTWLVLVKGTALVSVIGLTDMMYRAKQASGAAQAPFRYFLAAGAVYLLITSVSLAGLGRLARHLARSDRPIASQ